MKWKKFTLETTTDAVDYLGSMFDDIGIEGMEIEDNVPLTESETKGMFIDILPELPPDDGTARVSFYLDEDEDTEEKLKAVREGLEEIRQFVNIGTAKITESERDWMSSACSPIWAPGPSLRARQRIRTGSTTGNSTSNRLRLTISSSSRRGRRSRKNIRTSS